MNRISKLEQWRTGTERQKHLLAVAGSSIVTIILLIIWLNSLLSKMDAPTSEAQEQAATPTPIETVAAMMNEAFDLFGGGKTGSSSLEAGILKTN